ncbi:G-type lectin S-receptor-like serine/threonine-protein kinase LECRK1 isoform X2 [Hevea brasiliensis]|uniref:G-type lectin S-receptor-like serine/threonine-protein kinase LECRK1 isoform X2 n=1 Tax=Hevea brasiliensis TaxID=3981 RepID=UPI0025E8EC8E|nr:G-type lectin S-receptor-like serine/threonine-protein kinase LECRK1 isoform X2 [Hevea brasiliensis]
MNSKLKRMHRAQNLSMASVILFLFLSFTSIFKALAQRRYSNISLGSSLTPTTNSSWWSPSGLYAFGFYPQGTAYAIGVFIAGIPQKTVVWTAKRDDPPVDSNVNLLINDAGLVLEAQSQTTTVISAPQPASSASLFDSGNFVLYNSDRDIIWQSFDHPTDTLLPTQRLEADSELVSAVSETNHSTGIFRLRMQTDGNLVQYPVETPETAPYAYWSSGFASVNPGDRTAGCERNFTAESCKEDHKSIRIQEVLSTAWEDVSYSDLSLSIKGECEQACLQDCNCDAAFYKDGLCKKQKLPLRYGRRNPDESNSALIKVKSTSIRTNTDRNEPAVDKKKSDQLGRGVLIVGISVVAFGLVTLAISGILFHKYRVWAYKRISEKDHIGLSEEVAPRSFTFEELERVTDGFKEEIGRGSFGTVYKGLISSTQKVAAVKRLEGAASQGEREFQTEVKVIGKTHHKNLVRLLGYCNEGPNRLLVYEYMRNGSLADVIFSPESRPCFGERVEIARNIARGILYLHEECETQIIHCDIKPENILMDECWCPKISDFGLAKLLKPEQTKTFTGIRGTRGYVAPEWHRKLPVTVKADVYSFGIVLLEITCCRRNVDQNLPEIESILVDWVYHCFESGEIDKLVSEEEVDKRQMDRMIKVGLWCTLDEPSLRPSMKKVLLMLEGTVDIPIPPSPTSFLSAI